MRLAQFALLLPLLLTGWQQPVPTYSIHITGEPGSAVHVSISDEQSDGTITRTEWNLRTPGHMEFSTDRHRRLTIESETSVEARHFYESQGGKELLATLRGTLIEFDIPAR